MLERATEHLRQVVQCDAPVHPITVAVLPNGGGLSHIVLVVNLADDFLENVSSVMSPDVPPNSSTTIARWAGARWKSRSWLSSVLVSGT